MAEGEEEMSFGEDDDDDRLAHEEWYEEEEWPKYFGRPHKRSNPRKFQDGSGLAKPPLVAVYHVVNEWFVRVVGQSFCPKFADDGSEGDHAADVFCAVAEVLDHRYTPIHCKWVHGKHYRDLKIRY